MPFYACLEGGRTLPSVPTLLRLSDALDVEADRLLRGNQAEVRAPPAPKEAMEGPDVRSVTRWLGRLDGAWLLVLAAVAAQFAKGTKSSKFPSAKRSRGPRRG